MYIFMYLYIHIHIYISLSSSSEDQQADALYKKMKTTLVLAHSTNDDTKGP